MLSVFFGSDRKAVRDRAHEAFGTDSEVVVIDENSFVPGMLVEAVGSTSLFGETRQYLLDTPTGEEQFQEEVLSILEDMSGSSHTFVVMERTLLAPAKKKYGKHTATIEEFSADSAERFNAFAISDALAQKDKKTLWVLLQEARLAGLRDEELVGILWWQLKTMKLAATTSTASEAGVKDFPYNKAKRALTKFAPGEVDMLARTLLKTYHDAHKGLTTMDVALEKWVLSI